MSLTDLVTSFAKVSRACFEILSLTTKTILLPEKWFIEDLNLKELIVKGTTKFLVTSMKYSVKILKSFTLFLKRVSLFKEVLSINTKKVLLVSLSLGSLLSKKFEKILSSVSQFSDLLSRALAKFQSLFETRVFLDTVSWIFKTSLSEYASIETSLTKKLVLVKKEIITLIDTFQQVWSLLLKETFFALGTVLKSLSIHLEESDVFTSVQFYTFTKEFQEELDLLSKLLPKQLILLCQTLIFESSIRFSLFTKLLEQVSLAKSISKKVTRILSNKLSMLEKITERTPLLGILLVEA